ncbi:MAG: TIGR03905 family TSCPD domain-containing protein [Paeniclostridium sordellii]|uniref:ribonucleoside-diphosphate reductase n=1 Tax=Paeniclostridium hominis TaxID=2764329 RepID=A0ABR7K3T1_9FIRM|nr:MULTISPECIES: TIGR03905 family TSCPD domain-containing protein [Paeniclostridium]MBC6003758.1 TIGR03905 family TSCPD domain-containing protein [Paeniclostridium hominis]MBC8632680.1 TIGR03905 family TSCPD domain-containing protein [[Eubacterium] tenue]MDU2591643.1 TIGR03905 family TSCPD domain-containing protein [Paeniclostridium sordellii]
MYRYYTNGVCSKSILLDLDGDMLVDVIFEGGCAGNLLGIKNLIEGKTIDEIIETFERIPCKNRETSCPDQLANALKIYKKYVLNE